jgi:hypothetical protein
MTNSWKIAGSYFEACNCDVACPCIFLSPPTSGDCTLLIAWHIDQGRFGQIDLDGLNAVLAVHSPGHMLEVKWKVALYVDERADQSQQHALTQIFSGQAGGPLAGMAPLIGEVLGVKTARLSASKRRSISAWLIGCLKVMQASTSSVAVVRPELHLRELVRLDTGQSLVADLSSDKGNHRAFRGHDPA